MAKRTLTIAKQRAKRLHKRIRAGRVRPVAPKLHGAPQLIKADPQAGVKMKLVDPWPPWQR